MRFLTALVALGSALTSCTNAQQYMGDNITNSLPGVPGSEIAFFHIKDTAVKTPNNNLTLINYYSHGSNGKRLVESNIQRVVIVIHGQNRDPGTYMSNMLSALSQVKGDPNISFDKVAIMAPYFPNGEDKGTGYPWNASAKAGGYGSTSNALVWYGSQWSAGANCQYPRDSPYTSSYTVLDQITQYYDNATLFPNMKQIVIAGHSLGAQTVQRYAAIGNVLNTKVPVNLWIGNPNSFVWLNSSRPLVVDSCPSYDDYRQGLSNFTGYPMTYGKKLVASGSAAVVSNYQSKTINYGRGIQDMGDDASDCAPESQGANRNERFFNFINSWPPSCSNPKGPGCDTVDFVNTGHDAGAMFASPAGQARLFIDNFYGDGNRSYDFGYPRYQAGDDPYPNPALVNTPKPTQNNTGTYAGGMTYQGCWSDQNPQTLTNMAYSGNANSIEYCTSLCASSGNTIAGLEFGTQCFCGKTLGYQARQVTEMSCATACPGNATEMCGGGNRLSLFSNGVPSVQKAPVIPATIGNFSYIGCYTEASSGRALGGAGTSGNTISLDTCASYCSSYAYFGVEYASECYCGNSLGAGANQTDAGDCNMLCAANSTEICGAGNRLTTYQNPNFVPGTTSSPGSTGSTGSTGSGSGSTSSGLSCPGSNNATYVSNNQTFIVECGVDHSGGDLTSLSVSSFQQCIDTCATTAGCVDVSLSGSACYLKSTLGGAVQNSAIWGARLASASSASSSSGSSTSTTASSSTTTTTASSGNTLSCPASNGATYVSSNNQTFTIECGVDHSGGDMSSLSVSSFQQCVDTCATTTGCVDVSLSGSACYLKSTLGAAVSNGGISGAKLVTASSTATSVPSSIAGATSSASSAASSAAVSTTTTTSASSTASSVSLSCPASNGTTYVYNGQSFLIECGIDHQGGDMSSLGVSSFNQCVNQCATTTGCVDVSLSGSACYLKSTLGAAVANGGILGAKLITSASSSSSAVSTSTSSSVVSTTTTSSSAVSSSAVSTSSPSSSAASTSSISSSSAAPTTLSTITTTSTSTTSSTTSTSSSASASATIISCPASNSTTYISNGASFVIECGIDHAGGDMKSLSVSSFKQCIDTCATTPGCVDVSLSGSACYLKSKLGAAVNNGVQGARLVTSTTTSSAATATATQ